MWQNTCGLQFQTGGDAGTKLTSNDVGGDVYLSAETEERQRQSGEQKNEAMETLNKEELS